MQQPIEVRIDPEFHALIPPLSDDERRLLEENLVRDGCREPLAVWGDIVLDGHNRHEICERRGVIYRTIQVDVDSREDAKVWVIENQRGRRNLTPSQFAMLAADLAPLYAKAAKERMLAGKKADPPAELPEGGKGEAREKAAAAMGVSPRLVQDAKKVAENGTPELVESVLAGDVTVSKAVSQIKEETKAAERKKAAAAARKSVRAAKTTGIVHGDFREVAKTIKAETVALIFTDPPYDRKSAGFYADVAAIGKRVLAPGGSLMAYCGHYLLPEILPGMAEHLRFWWLCGCQHTGHAARMREYGIVVQWKPIPWFVKGTRGNKRVFVEDLVSGQREKYAHDWQQAVAEASYYIEKLTEPGDLVFDPFCGGGTTAVACKQLGRRWLTCDVDDDSVAIARQRVGP